MEFNFDSEENIKAAKTPSVKVLNSDAKLWVSNENAEMCKWKGDLISHNIKTDREAVTIPGNNSYSANAYTSTLPFVKSRN